MKNKNITKFKKYLKRKTSNYQSFLFPYAILASSDLTQKIGNIYCSLEKLKPNQEKEILFLIGEYSKATYCKSLQYFNFKPFPHDYNQSIKSDLNGLFSIFDEKIKNIVLSDYKKLEYYKKTYNKSYLQDNIFCTPRGGEISKGFPTYSGALVTHEFSRNQKSKINQNLLLKSKQNT